MHLLAQADALIIDMRANSGGLPGTATLLISYLIGPPGLPLFDIVHRAPLPADHYATEASSRTRARCEG